MPKINKIIQYGLYLIMLLPLVFTPFTFFPWHFGKTVIFQIVVELLVVVWLVGARHAVPVRNRFNYLDWSILAFLAFITITALTGVSPANSFWGHQDRANSVFVWWHFVAYYFLLKYFLVGTGLKPVRTQPVRVIVPIAVIVAILASLTSIFPQILPVSWQSTAGGGIIGNRAFLANYLVLAVGLSVFCVTLLKNKWRWLFVASSVFLAYTIYLTNNRGALLGLLAGVFVGLLLFIFVATNKKLKIGLVAFLLIFLSLASYHLYPNFRSLTSGTGETRLMAWNIAWQGIKAKPIGGWGWGNYNVVFDKFYNPNFLKYSFVETVWDKPHNWLLEINVTGGLVSALAYLVILISACFYLLKNKNPILLATLLGGFVSGLFLFETSNSLILWFLVLAMTSAQSQTSVIPAPVLRSSSATEDGKAGIQQAPSRRLDSLFQGNDKSAKLVVALCVVLIVYFLFLNSQSLKYSYYMRQAELSTVMMDWIGWADKALLAPEPFKSENAIFLAQQFVNFDKAGVTADKKEIKESALSLVSVLDLSMEKNPSNLSYPVWSGQVYTILGEKFDKKYYADAEQVLKRAVGISSQKQEVHFLLGRLYLLQPDLTKALAEQRLAVDIAPQISSSHWFYGLVLIASGDRPAGLLEIEKALELGYGVTAEQKLYILDLYAEEKNYSKLIGEYKKLIEAEPDNINWYIKLATVYAVAGDKKSALDLAQYILSQAPQIKTEIDNFIREYNLK